MRIRATVRLRNEKMLAARERLGLTQRAVAELAHCGQAAYSDLERLKFAKTMVYERAVMIANVLEIDPEDIFPVELEGWQGQTTFHASQEMTPIALMEAAKVREERFTLPAPSDTVEQQDLLEKVKECVDELPEKNRQVLVLRYGLGDKPPMSNKEICEYLGKSKETIHMREVRAIHLVQKIAENKGLGL